MSDLVCARCDQPIRFRELFHPATRAAQIGDDPAYVVSGERVIVHDYPCPTRIEIRDGRVFMNGMDLGPADKYTRMALNMFGTITDIQTPGEIA